MNKTVIISLLLLVVSNVQSQNESVVNNTSQTIQRASNILQSSYGSATYFYNPQREVEGSIYLFDSWENMAIIKTQDGKRYSLNNLNLNVKHNVFQSSFSKDSIFTFNFNNIDRIVVNNKVFKNYYWNDTNSVYEIIYELDSFQILKGFSLRFVEGSANPMVNRSTDKYIIKTAYYIRKDGLIKPFKFSRRKILNLITTDKIKQKKIIDYSKKNKFSFSKEYDVKRILDYVKSI